MNRRIVWHSILHGLYALRAYGACFKMVSGLALPTDALRHSIALHGGVR